MHNNIMYNTFYFQDRYSSYILFPLTSWDGKIYKQNMQLLVLQKYYLPNSNYLY